MARAKGFVQFARGAETTACILQLAAGTAMPRALELNQTTGFTNLCVERVK